MIHDIENVWSLPSLERDASNCEWFGQFRRKSNGNFEILV